MNEKNYFTIVVPLSPDAQKIVQGNPSAVPLRAAVWSQAAERMKPLLGGVCSRFSPAVAPYGEPLHLPFGIPYSVAQPLERGSNNYYSIIQGERFANQPFMLLVWSSGRVFHIPDDLCGHGIRTGKPVL